MFERNKWQICIQQEGLKESMERMMNKENAWDQKTEIARVKDPVEKVSLKKTTSAMKKMKLGKTSGLSKVSTKIINVSEKFEIDVLIKLCLRVLDGKEMPEDWKTSMMVPI